MPYMLTVAALIVVIEIIRLATISGSLDIDDFILSFAGAAIGFIVRICLPIRRLFKLLALRNRESGVIMRENKYDDKIFFDKYSQMPRSTGGLESAGEWHILESMLPSFKGKRVLDLGCGFGWHCIYAAEQGAASVVGVDISEKMLERAKEKTDFSQVCYIHSSIEEYNYPEKGFDAVISSLAFHYIENFDDVCVKVSRCLVTGGDFVFSAEHPVFTARGSQDWVYDELGNILHWAVDRYFDESKRSTRFLGEEVAKYHRTLTTYINCLLRHGFAITGLCEPTPAEHMLESQGMKDELRRPMMLIIAAEKI